MQSFRKIEWAVSEIFKDGQTTDGRTNKGDYYGPIRVNPGSNKLDIQEPFDYTILMT